jgi:hypothetical protein
MGHWFGRVAGVCFAAWGVLMGLVARIGRFGGDEWTV